MKPLLRFVDLLLYTSLFTACCASGLCMATERFVNGVSPALFSPLHFLLFGGTLVVYNAPRLFFRKSTAAQPYRSWYILFFAIGLAMLSASVFWLQWKILVFCIALAVLTFAYSLPVLPFMRKKRLREYGWLKILVLAGVWTVVTTLLPIFYWHKMPGAYPFELLNRFVFIFALCMVFDIRDINTDTRNNVNTLPHKLGLDNSYRIITTSLLLFAILGMAQYLKRPVLAQLAAAWVTAIATWLVAYYLRKKPTERGYMGLADGVMLVYAAINLL